MLWTRSGYLEGATSPRPRFYGLVDHFDESGCSREQALVLVRSGLGGMRRR